MRDGLDRRLFPDPPRYPRGVRWLQVASRTAHVATMGLVLGGLAWGAPDARLHGTAVLAALSGLALLALELARSLTFLWSGAGLAMWAKLALLGLGQLWPSRRYELYLAATLLASVGSHMPRSFRHVLLGPGRHPRPRVPRRHPPSRGGRPEP